MDCKSIDGMLMKMVLGVYVDEISVFYSCSKAPRLSPNFLDCDDTNAEFFQMQMSTAMVSTTISFNRFLFDNEYTMFYSGASSGTRKGETGKLVQIQHSPRYCKSRYTPPS